ncbi:MAG: MFS transporter [Solirubrobacteraceae bacterium]
MLGFLRKVAIDVSPIRESRDYRLLATGEIVANVGTQAALVALPYQIFVTSHSPTLVGLLGAFELGPMIVVSLLGGVLNDRYERRLLLAIAQIGVIAAAGALCAAALIGHPPVLLVLVLGGLLAGGSALDGVTRSAIIPGMLGSGLLRAGLAFNYGVAQLTGIVGPAVGGLLIAVAGLATTYGVDAVSCVAMLVAAIAIGPQRPVAVDQHPPVLRAVADGLRFVRANRALSGSFAIDLVAMTFGMPRVLFAVLSLTIYHAGATGTGFLYSAVAAGGTMAVLSSGWVAHTRRLGRIVIVAVLIWGAAIAGAGLVRSIAPALLLLCVAGWADGISAVCRSSINQLVTPDELRGRMSSVFSLVVTSGPRLGDIESGVVAGLTSALTAVLAGGVACVIGTGLIVLAFPQLAAFDAEQTIAGLRSAAATAHS